MAPGPDRTAASTATGGPATALARPALRRLPARVLGVVLLAMTAVNALNAATRHFFGFQLTGSDELLAFAQVWIVMLGLIGVTATRRHLALDLFAGLGPRATAARLLAIDLLFCVVAGWAAVQSFAFVTRMWAFGSTSMALGVPMVVPHGAVLIGLAGTALVAAGLSVADLRALVRAGREAAR
jgi:TRAP-type C4-dicarboxylate transport system permease small subunit